MEAFATYDDLMATPNAPDVDEDMAETLLERASAFILSQLGAHGIEVDPQDEVQAVNLKSVCCNLVSRTLSTGAVDGVASLAQAIGSTSVQVSYSNPDASFFLTAGDKSALGIGGGRLGWARMGG